MTSRRVRWALALAIAVCAACSDDPGGDPGARERVADVVRAMAAAEPATIEIRLPYATADDLHQLSVGITPERAALLEGASLTLKNDFATNPLRAHFSAELATTAGRLEVRQIEDDLYLRADVAELARVLDESPRPFFRTLARSKAFRPLLAPALTGRWVHFYGVRDLGVAASGDRGRGRSERAAAALARAVEDGAAVTAEGRDSVGDRYRVDIDLRRFTEALFEGLEGLVPVAPSPDELEAIPDERITLDVWIDDGLLRRIEADVSQLLAVARPGSGIERDPLIVRFDVTRFDPEGLRPPDAMVRVHASTFFQLLLAGRTGS
ncbi:MAG TPA: hypothetical protein VHN37_03070 [Actinomycetota bacterium]|nr:hypothetical protein [Actinomycetota bacterium]